jgi:hypothetical protein
MDEIQLLVADTNKYYNQYLDTLENDGCSLLPDVTIQKIYVFPVLIIQLRDDEQDTLKD